jgi:hypothetical protein
MAVSEDTAIDLFLIRTDLGGVYKLGHPDEDAVADTVTIDVALL